MSKKQQVKKQSDDGDYDVHIDDLLKEEVGEEVHDKIQQQFFTKKNSTDFHKSKRVGLGGETLSNEAERAQQKNEQNNKDLRYKILERHSAKKRNKKKGLLIDYGESEDEEKQENSNNSEEEEGKGSRFASKSSVASKNRQKVQKVQELLSGLTNSSVNKKRKATSDQNNGNSKKKRKD